MLGLGDLTLRRRALAGGRRSPLRRRDGLVAARRLHAGVGQPRMGTTRATTCATTRAASRCPTPRRRRARPRRAAAARTGTGSTRARSASSSTRSRTRRRRGPTGRARRSRCSPRPQADPALRFIVTAGHRPAYSSGHHGGKPQLRAILDGFGERFGKYVLNLTGHSHNYERTKPQAHVVHVTAGIGGGAAGARRRPRASGPTASSPPWVAFRAIHHGFVKLTVRADGIALEAICAGASPAEDSVRCADGEIMDQALIAAGALTARSAPPSAATAASRSTRRAATARRSPAASRRPSSGGRRAPQQRDAVAGRAAAVPTPPDVSLSDRGASSRRRRRRRSSRAAPARRSPCRTRHRADRRTHRADERAIRSANRHDRDAARDPRRSSIAGAESQRKTHRRHDRAFAVGRDELSPDAPGAGRLRAAACRSPPPTRSPACPTCSACRGCRWAGCSGSTLGPTTTHAACWRWG